MFPDERAVITPLGDSAVVVTFGDTLAPEVHRKVIAFAAALDAHTPPGMIEFIPAFTTVTVMYDPLRCTYDEFVAALESVPEPTPHDDAAEPEVTEIPVCYGGDLGPDLDVVAEHNGLATDDVVAIHSEDDYLVYMIGFAPGFPYLGGMSERIATPRRDRPRVSVPAGSVGIAGRQTGVYPIATPGGWQLIGRTPLKLFRPNHDRPSLLTQGDRVRFVPIDSAAYDRLSEGARS